MTVGLCGSFGAEEGSLASSPGGFAVGLCGAARHDGPNREPDRVTGHAIPMPLMPDSNYRSISPTIVPVSAWSKPDIPTCCPLNFPMNQPEASWYFPVPPIMLIWASAVTVPSG